MPRYLDLEVIINGTEPPVWRRFLIRPTATFHDLNDAIQDAFGWQNCHLWEFRTPGRRGDSIAGIPMKGEPGWGNEVPDATKVRLSSYFRGGKGGKRKCVFIYDFGDDWVHSVALKKQVDEEVSFERRLIGGDWAGPLEDCGGVWGYQRMAELVRTGEDPADWGDTDEILEWIGDWDPDDFALDKAKKSFDR